jgi:hypothetical protein
LALGDARAAHGLHQIVDRSGRNAFDVGLLNNGGERLLGQTPGFEKARKIRALAQLGDTQLHRSGARLPVAVAIAVALIDPLGRAFAMGGPRQRADLHLHQALGGEADHLA